MDGTATAVHVEVILLRLDGGRLHYRCTRSALPDGAVPDDLALELADPSPRLPALPLTAPAVVCSADPTRPTPSDLRAHHIAAHAVRHLAYLADTDPTVAAAAAALCCHDLWKVIRAVGGDIPAGVHETVHRIAEHRTAS